MTDAVFEELIRDAEAALESIPDPRRKRRERLRLVPPSELDPRGAALDLIEGILGRGMLAMLFGASGSAKTFIALAMALSVATGRAWCGRRTRRGFVVYIAAEAGASLNLRVHAWSQFNGVALDDNLAFRVIPAAPDLCGDGDAEAIIANIEEAKATCGPCLLVVVDTVSRAMPIAEENSGRDAGAFVERCDAIREATGATVLSVHHTPKNGETPRGHSKLTNDQQIRLLAEKCDDGFTLTVKHLKDVEAGARFNFDIATVTIRDAAGESHEGGVLVQAEAAKSVGRPKAGRLTDPQRLSIEAVRNHCRRAKSWKISFAEFNRVAVSCGAIDPDRQNVQKRGFDLRAQLAAKRLVKLEGDEKLVTLLDPDLFN